MWQLAPHITLLPPLALPPPPPLPCSRCPAPVGRWRMCGGTWTHDRPGVRCRAAASHCVRRMRAAPVRPPGPHALHPAHGGGMKGWRRPESDGLFGRQDAMEAGTTGPPGLVDRVLCALPIFRVSCTPLGPTLLPQSPPTVLSRKCGRRAGAWGLPPLLFRYWCPLTLCRT